MTTAIGPALPSSTGLPSLPVGALVTAAIALGTYLGGKNAEREMEEGIQIDYDQIYVRANTGISNIEEELEEAKQETRTS